MLRTKNNWSSSKDDILRSCFSEDSSDNTFSSLSYFAKEEGEGRRERGKLVRGCCLIHGVQEGTKR